MNAPPRVLVADDQADVLEALRLLLKPEGFEVELAASPQAVLSAVAARPFDALLIDLNYTRDTTSGGEGLELLAELHALAPALPVVVMTAWASIGLAVEAMRRGAADFVPKPWDNAQLVATLRARVEARTSVEHAPSLSPLAGRDLWVARAVQERLLPRQAPRLSTLRCAARCEESELVGGDLYDFLDLGAGRVGIAVADVSGKGMPAAIVMAHLSAALRSLTPELQKDLAHLMRRVNALLLDATAAQHYVTLFLGVYDESRRTLRYVNCGHLPPILLRATGDVAWLAPTAPAVGLLEGFGAHEEAAILGAGDTLLVYSDGVTETLGREGEELGAERLLSALRQSADADAESLVAKLMDTRRAFATGAERDDVTVLVAQGC